MTQEVFSLMKNNGTAFLGRVSRVISKTENFIPGSDKIQKTLSKK